MKVMYLSHFISVDTPLYGGAKSVEITQYKFIYKGDSCNMLFLSIPNHTSTHIDLPYHFLKDGKKLEDFDPDFWIFKNVGLIELRDVEFCEIITWEKIASTLLKYNSIELLLLKTGFEKYRGEEVYWSKQPGIHPEVAKYLREKFPLLKAVGMDIISISSWCNRELGRKAHREFLEREILLIEDMKLSDVDSAPDVVIALPLLIKGADGAPITVIGIWNSEERE